MELSFEKLLKKMFVDYVSPESVKHASKLLGFMAMEDKLTNDHLTMMWRAGLNNGPEIEVWPCTHFRKSSLCCCDCGNQHSEQGVDRCAD